MCRQRVKGYLTIYISLTLMIMLSLCLTLIEGARRSSIRLEAECITDMGIYSVMAEYHRELFRQYNLFYIDSSYGTDKASFYHTQARLEYYLEQNMQEEDVTYFDFVYKDLLGLELLSTVVEKVAFASDDGGRRFQKKAAGVIYDDMGVGMVENVLEWVGLVEEYRLTEYDTAKEIKAVEEQIGEIVENNTLQGEKKWISLEIPNFMEYMEELLSMGVLNAVLDGEKISEQTVDLSAYISARQKRGVLNSGNAGEVTEVSVAEKILFHEYLLKYAGYYGQEKPEGLLKYQVEYLLTGKNSDKENLAQVIAVLCGIRCGANTVYLYGDSEKRAAVETVASALATLIFMPELAPFLETLIILSWAYVESLYDVKVLLAGGKVPLLKDSVDWHYDLDSLFQKVEVQVENPSQKGLSYADYLRVLLYLTNAQKLTFRFLDVMEMDIRQTQGNEAFRVDGCVEYIEAEVVFKARSGYKHTVKVQTSYE